MLNATGTAFRVVPVARLVGVAQIIALLAVLLPSISVSAAGNDVVLRRLGDCTFDTIDGREVCVAVTPDNEGFTALTRDLGLSLSPKGMAPAETLGISGFNYGFDLIFNVVDGSQAYWRALENNTESNLLMVSQFHVRKGLPFSFELGGVLSHYFGSSMWAVGVEVAWALHEDFLWPVPDLGVRGFVNNVVGSADLNLTTAGLDVILDVPIGSSNVIEITPYLGYNMTIVFASSRLLDASPGDNTPPVEGGEGVPSVKPEFVFDNESNAYHGFVGGVRFRYTLLNITAQTDIRSDVVSFGFHLGLDF